MISTPWMALSAMAYTGYKCLQRKCSTQLSRLPFPAQRIDALCLARIIGDWSGIHQGSFPGVIHNVSSGPPGELCNSYVARQVNLARIPLNNTVDFLRRQRYEPVEKPKAGDIVLYFNPNEPTTFQHIGIVTRVDGSAVWVESKWGNLDVYEHQVQAVLSAYGNAITYLRKT